MFYYKEADRYVQNRENIIKLYMEKMTQYLKTLYPHLDNELIYKKVREITKQKFNDPSITLEYHPYYGKTETKEVKLLDYTKKYIKDNIYSASGSVYTLPSKEESLIRKIIDENIELRNVFKKRMLEAIARNQDTIAQINKLLQSSVKIFNNAQPGQAGCQYSFIHSVPNYNAITATGRISVKTGYSHTERLLTGNYYVTSVDDVINYSLTMLKAYNEDRVKEIISRFDIHLITSEDFYDTFAKCLAFYKIITPEDTNCLMHYANQLGPYKRSFIIYAYNLYSFIYHNKALLRSYIHSFFIRDVPLVDEPLENIFKIENDLFVMALSLNFDLIHREPDLKIAFNKYPDGIRQLLSICRYMSSRLTDWEVVWSTFFCIDADIPNIPNHENMIRQCTIRSDTDSVIFTTDRITTWYEDGEYFTQKTYDINAFCVFILVQTLEHILKRLSAGIGMENIDRDRIKMKNEFFYLIFISTVAKKHYAGLIAIQEGKILSKMKKDIKGVALRGSGIPNISVEKNNEFICSIIDKLTHQPTISSSYLIEKVAQYEYDIIKNLREGHKTYLALSSIKTVEAYKNPLITIYFFYELWQEVFACKYGDIILPNKVYEIPITPKKNNAQFRDSLFLQQLRDLEPSMPDRLISFLDKYPKKEITRLIMPQNLPQIPEVIRPLINTRKIVYKNGAPFYLILRSFGIAINDAKNNSIALDYYAGIQEDSHLPAV